MAYSTTSPRSLVSTGSNVGWVLGTFFGWLHYYLWDGVRDEAEDLDLDWMGKAFELSGGHIRNAALRAGMLAADADAPLSMRTARLPEI